MNDNDFLGKVEIYYQTHFYCNIDRLTCREILEETDAREPDERCIRECRRGSGGILAPSGKFCNVESRYCHFLRFQNEIVPFLMLFWLVRINFFHMMGKIARLLSRNCPTN